MVVLNSMKQILRTPFKTLLIIVLLALAGAFLAIGMGLWSAAQRSLAELNTSLTTIAVPNLAGINMQAKMAADIAVLDEELLQTEDASSILRRVMEQEQFRLFALAKEAGDASAVARPTQSRAISACSPETPGFGRPGDNLSVFVVSCAAVREDIIPEYWDGSKYLSVPMSENNTSLKVEQALRYTDSKTVPEWFMYRELKTGSLIDAEKPFEQGKTYVVIGGLTSSVMYLERLNPKTGRFYRLTEAVTEDANFKELMIPMIFSLYDNSGRERPESASGMPDYYDSLRIEIDGDVDKFLASEEWKRIEGLIESAEKTASSLNVLTTDNIMEVQLFNTYQAKLTAGRFFTSSEYDSGALVCLVSKVFAAEHDLKVGDSISLGFYDSGYTNVLSANYMVKSQPIAYDISIPILEPKEYKIVGLYFTPKNSVEGFTFPEDTVFVPDKSVGEIDLLYDELPISRYALTLPNGAADAFMSEMDALENGSLFVLYDQGYSTLIDSITSLKGNTQLVAAVCALAWITSVAFFLIVFVWHQGSGIGIMLSLGAGKRRAVVSLVFGCLLIVTISSVAAFYAGDMLFQKATDIMFEASSTAEPADDFFTNQPLLMVSIKDRNRDAMLRELFEMPDAWKFIAFTCAVQGALIVLIAWVVSVIMVKHKPLELVKGGGLR